jgi:hypothetical protein
MITKNQAEQILIDNIKCDTVIRDLLKEVPGQNNVVTQKLPNGDILQYVGNPWGLLSATYAYEGADDWYTFDFTSLNNVHPKSGLASMWHQLTAQFAKSDSYQETLFGYAKYFSLLDLDFEYLPQHPRITKLLGEAATFYLPKVTTYCINNNEKTGVYIHVHDRYSRHGKTQLQQFITGKENNLFFATKLPVSNCEFDQSYDSEELLSFGYILARCGEDFFITEPQYLTTKLKNDRLEVPVDELFEAHEWLEERTEHR